MTVNMNMAAMTKFGTKKWRIN